MLTPSSIFQRRSKGDDVKESASKTHKLEESTKKYVCPNGIQFESMSEMARHYGVGKDVYFRRLKLGWSLEETLGLKERDVTHIHPNSKKVVDHLGNIFPSQTAMTKAYNINLHTFLTRIKAGITLEQALTQRADSEFPKIDHKGVEYASVGEMASAYGLSRGAFKARLNKGMTLEEALCTEKRSDRVKDHLGREYDSQIEMAKVYGLTKVTFWNRLKRGMTLEEALTAPLREQNSYDGTSMCFGFDSLEVFRLFGITDRFYENKDKPEEYLARRIPDLDTRVIAITEDNLVWLNTERGLESVEFSAYIENFSRDK